MEKLFSSIWIVAAHQDELGSFWTSIKKSREKSEIEIKKFSINESNILLAITGLGLTYSGKNLELLFKRCSKPNLILNIGTAGSLSEDLKIGYWIIPEKIEMNKLKNGAYPSIILRSEYIELIEKISLEMGKKVKKGTLLSSEKPVKSLPHKKIINSKSSAIAVDMEAYRLAQITGNKCIPLVFLKRITDLADKRVKNDYKHNIKKYFDDTGQFIKYLLEKLVL